MLNERVDLVGMLCWCPGYMYIAKFLFADDVMAMSTTRESTESAALDEVTSEWGLTVSVPKI